MDELNESRTTSVGLFHYAHSYAASAAALTRNGITATHPEAPIRFLYSHAVELYLKAFLRARGVELSRLRSRSLGHDLCALLDEAIKMGFESDRPMQSEISSLNDAIRDRYIVTGVRHLLPVQALHSLCERMNAQVGPIAYKTVELSRLPPSI